MYRFYRLAVAVPKLILADSNKNIDNIISLLKEADKLDVSIILFPELSITGYSIGDLFFQQKVYESQLDALKKLLEYSKSTDMFIVIGAFVKYQDRLYNCAIAIQSGKIAGVVPKIHIPNKKEYYEYRYFVSGRDIKDTTISLLNQNAPFGIDMIFEDGNKVAIGIEICEDLWAVEPPSGKLAVNGANIILNPSASNELISKSEYRDMLVSSQSARTISAYAYCSSGVGESSTDTIFGGDSMIYENGTLLCRGQRFGHNLLNTADIDIEKLSSVRLSETAYFDSEISKVTRVSIKPLKEINDIERFIDPHPFVPSNPTQRDKRSKEITDIQAYSLIRRVEQSQVSSLVIGISGGLDSTLALLSIYKAVKIMNWNSKSIIAVTMPGFGTTDRTYNNAVNLCNKLNVTLKEIPIKELSLLEFDAIGHSEDIKDVVYENVQARIRTSILMNLANKYNGLVIGTGDLSEIALGWSTYNGDHMSMYAINSSIPKTLVRYLVEYYAHQYQDISNILIDILDTPVSPELLPHQDGKIVQETEEIVGPYELHDFFLYHFVRYGTKPKKLLYLATKAFKEYEKSYIKKWLKVFLRRFFTQQFKRSCMPDGPKVGTVSLSPRADWRMPSDANADIWLKELDEE